MSQGRKEIFDRRPWWPPFLSSDDDSDDSFVQEVNYIFGSFDESDDSSLKWEHDKVVSTKKHVTWNYLINLTPGPACWAESLTRFNCLSVRLSVPLFQNPIPKQENDNVA